MAKGKKKHLLKNLKIGEVSMVGQGANQGAFVTLLKTEDPTTICKQMFSDVMQQMAVSDELRAILNQSWKMGDALYDSFHSILMNPEITEKKSRMLESFNQYISAMTATITNSDVIKEINKITKNEGDEMSKELEKEVETLKKQAETNAGLLADALALAGMNDVQKAYHGTLSTEDKAVFIKKTPAEMDEAIAKVEEGKEKYTTSTGTTICKSEVGEATFAIFKAQDERIAKQAAELKAQDAKIEKQNEEAILKSFIKIAETEYPNLPGTPEEKGALLKSIDAMPEDEKATALAMFKSGNETGTGLFKEHGAGGGDTMTAVEKLNKMAKDKAEKDSISFEKAYSEVVNTAEGQKLYEETSK